jgi:hypothetical protein
MKRMFEDVHEEIKGSLNRSLFNVNIVSLVNMYCVSKKFQLTLSQRYVYSSMNLDLSL